MPDQPPCANNQQCRDDSRSRTSTDAVDGVRLERNQHPFERDTDAVSNGAPQAINAVRVMIQTLRVRESSDERQESDRESGHDQCTPTLATLL